MARLFEQGGDVTPELDKRVAWGKVGEPTQNSSWGTIVNWLESVLGFLRKDANLSDLTNKTAARENLGVYSTGQVDTKLGDRALRNNVLEKNNTTPYTPTSSYHPATRKMVLDLVKESSPLSSMIIDPDFYSAFVEANSVVRVQQYGKVVTVNGTFKGVLPESGSSMTMYSLPSGIKPPEYDFIFGVGSAGDRGGLLTMGNNGKITCHHRGHESVHTFFFNFTYIAKDTY